MIYPVTTQFAVALAVLMLVLWINVTKTRAAKSISIGDGGEVAQHERIRRYGNFMEWVPITLILMALAEAQGAGAVWLYAAGGLALIGRMVHPFGLKADNASHVLRIVGNTGNIIATLILIVTLGRIAIAS